MKLEGKVAWVTGGTTGIGKAVATRLIKNGVRVMVTARNEKRGKEVEVELGENCLFVPADVTDTEAMQNAVDTVVEKWGRLDILDSNAGYCVDSWCLTMSPTEATQKGEDFRFEYTGGEPGSLEAFKEMVACHLIGPFDAARLAAYQMAKNEPNENGERGAIILTSSISATKRHSPGIHCGYTASKSGILGLTKEISCNLAPVGIRVNSVIPGFIDTPIVSDLGPMYQPWIDAEIFPKGAGDPDYIAMMVQQMVENPFMNNSVVEVTAGFASIPPLS